MRLSQHVVLVGLMGAGKTTVGRLLAERLSRLFVDNDEQLASIAGRSARDIADELGVDALHALERDALAEALGSSVPAVIAAAASVIEDDAIRARLEHDSFVVWLRVDVDELEQRVHRQSHRPLAADAADAADQLRTQAATRSGLFAEIADVTVDADRAPDVVVDDVLRQLR